MRASRKSSYFHSSLIYFFFIFSKRYLRALQNLDLNNGFYFSYTYDLTHTLQYNLTESNVNENENLNQDVCWGTRYQPTWKYVWNEYLLEPLRKQVHPRWWLFIIHG